MGLAAVSAAAIGVHHAAKVIRLKVELAGGGRLADKSSISISIGVGLYLVILAGLILALGAISSGRRRRAT